MDVFRKYFRDNAEPFIGYPPKRDMESAEHTLEHWDLFQTYLKLYEDTLNEWLEREGVENAQFYKDVQHVQDCVEIKILRRVRAASSRRPPRRRRDACSMAWTRRTG